MEDSLLAAASADGEPTSASLTPDSDSIQSIDDVEVSLQGITMLLNNEWAEAEALFAKHRDYSPLMSFGSSFVACLQAIMTFEDEKLAQAMKSLQDTEKKCESRKGFKGLKKKKKLKKDQIKVVNLEEQLQCRVILADTILYQAMLTFINQDLTSYIKGGWLLRKSWKVYDKTHRQIMGYHAKALASTPGAIPKTNSSRSLDSSSGADPNGDAASFTNIDLTEDPSLELSLEVTTRLLGSVSFGYGIFQLCISLVPPKILKLIEFFGFEADRHGGLSALDIASKSRDMKAPLAIFTLVWYHTVIRPFFALDGINLTAGVPEAEEIISRCEKEYPKSALYLFFKGRVLRLKSEIDEAFSTYRLALEQCANQRETQLICMYEIGFLSIMTLNWREAFNSFMTLKQDSRWSKCYYGYLTAVCQGSMGDVKAAHEMLREVPGLVKRKNNQLEAFVAKRANRFKKVAPTEQHCVLLLLEILYLWNAIPSCKRDDLQRMLDECNKQTERNVFHLRSLLEGAIYRQLDNEETAIQCFEEAVARHQDMKDDHHVFAFANYELGSIYLQRPEDFDQAKKHFQLAKDQYKDYDFDGRLGVRINAALKRMKTEGTPV